MIDEWGIEDSYVDAFGVEHPVSPETIGFLRDAMGEPSVQGPLVIRSGDTPRIGAATVILEDGTSFDIEDTLPADLPLGYHLLGSPRGERQLVVAPHMCHVPSSPAWGWAIQLYAARSAHSWGMGDLGDLALWVDWARGEGAGMVLISPLGAVAPTSPIEPSPYFPASRRFLNPLYLRVEDVPGISAAGPEVAQAARAGRALGSQRVIDRDEVWRWKRVALEAIWAATDPGDEYRAWEAAQGRPLIEFSVWAVLAERHGRDWRHWPAALRDPTTSQIGRIERESDDLISFHRWLQWLCRSQLVSASAGLMLVQDLPIGFDPGGADAWAWQEMIADQVTIGAPPDEFNTQGQDWGIPPFLPHRLEAAGYQPFLDTLRANLVGGGGLRIDHVMGLFRQFWIPAGASPGDGAYVHFPHDDLLSLVALESVRADAVVVGEDLGTVAPGVREELARRGLLSYRLLWFEEDDPATWPELALASVTTHDLPTVAGLWTGEDLDEQRRLGLAANAESTQALRDRLAGGIGIDPSAELDDVVVAVHRRLAEAPARLLCATLDDLALEVRRPNIPGSDEVRPNWSLALPRPLEELTRGSVARRMVGVLGRRGDPGMERDAKT